MPERFTRKDVVCGWTGYSGDLPKKKRKTRSPVPRSTVTLTHQPTGVSVSADLPRRRLSRRAMQDQVLKLRRRLLRELEKAVARARRRGVRLKRDG